MTAAAIPLPPLLSPAVIRARLEAATQSAVTLTNGAYTTVDSWLVDTYATRGGELVLTKSDGSEIRRRVLILTNSTSGADATTISIESHGTGTHANLAERDWIDADLSGATTSQVARLRVKVGAAGWTARFVPDFLKAA